MYQYGAPPSEIPGSTTPVRAAPTGLTSLSVGTAEHMCGTTAAHVAVCWGRNWYGEIGAGTTSNGSVPKSPGTGPWAELSVSRTSSCGVTVQSVGYCWGSNQRGEIGNAIRGIKQAAATPIAIDGNFAYSHVAAGWLHACALTTTGQAYCWGDNTSGQLGIGVADSVAHRTPTRVQTSLRFAQLSVSGRYACGIAIDHSAYCWGENVMGALGDGATVNRPAPTRVMSRIKFTAIVTSSGFAGGRNVKIPTLVQGGAAHTCALAESGASDCWGWNGARQIGDGTLDDRMLPVAVSGGQTFNEIGVGGAETCGTSKNAVWCWGGNEFGQVGNGSTANVNVPTLVGAPFNQP